MSVEEFTAEKFVACCQALVEEKTVTIDNSAELEAAKTETEQAKGELSTLQRVGFRMLAGQVVYKF